MGWRDVPRVDAWVFLVLFAGLCWSDAPVFDIVLALLGILP